MKKASLLLSVFLLAGCAGANTMAINRSIVPMLKGKTLSVVTHESPSFIAMTSGKGMFAVAGVGAAAASGNNLVKENQIADPAPNIGKVLAEDLDTRYGLSIKEQTGKKVDSTDTAEIAKQAAGSDYALDVETKGWSFIYDGFHFSDYLVSYSVKMRLIDVASTKVVSEGFCAYDTKRAGKPLVRYEKLLENHAAYIKQTLDDATAACVEKFKTELF